MEAMVSKFDAGSRAYIIENHRIVKEITVVSRRGDFYDIPMKVRDDNGFP